MATEAKKPIIRIKLKPIVVFPGMIGGLELVDADKQGPSTLVVHAGSPIPVATIEAAGELNKAAALMAFRHATIRIGGSAMSAPPITGHTHGDNSPMTAESLFQGIQAGFDAYEFVFEKGW